MPSIPPMPVLDAQWVWPLAAVCVAFGGLMVAWGNKYHRTVIALMGAGYGMLIGGAVVNTLHSLGLPLPPLAGQITIALILGLTGIVAAQIAWALFTVQISVTAAACLLVYNIPNAMPATAPSAGGFVEWCHNLLPFLAGGLTQAWALQKLEVVLTLFSAGAIPLVVWLFLPRLAAITTTALLGAMGIILGALLGAGAINADWWDMILQRPPVLGAAVGGMMTFGMICQYRQDSTKPTDLAEDDDEDDRGPARTRTKGAENKKRGKKKAKRGD